MYPPHCLNPIFLTQLDQSLGLNWFERLNGDIGLGLHDILMYEMKNQRKKEENIWRKTENEFFFASLPYFA